MFSTWRLWASALCLAASACKSDPTRADSMACESVYAHCPRQPPLSSHDATECARILDGACGTTMRQYVGCVTGKCDDAGAIDRIAIETQCGRLFEAYRECVSADGGSSTRGAPAEGPEPAIPDASVDGS